jgi:hypothetical protein
MKSRMTHRSGLSTLIAAGTLAALACMAGCGGKGAEEKASATAANGAAAKAGATNGTKAEERMANAVVSGKTTAPLDLQYDLAAKPDVGQPIEITLQFLPRAAADTLQLEVSSVPGLALLDAGTAKFEKVQTGEAVTSKVRVQADQAGIYYVNVVAHMATKVQTEVRTFSVPVVVGNAPVVQKPAPPKDAAGQPIQSMPAKEVPAKEQ